MLLDNKSNFWGADQNRAYFIINFSTQIKTYEQTEKKTIKSLISFLQRSFHGGTDVEPALECALDLLQQENYEKADILVISDFEIGQFSREMQNKIAAQKQKKTKFNALVISAYNSFGISGYEQFYQHSPLSFFDNQWQYSPTTGEIVELTKSTSSS